MQVTGILIYPIKATAAISLPQSEVRPRGLAGDRRWVVMGEGGQFLHQRVQPRLALVKTALSEGGGLQVDAAGMPPLHVAKPAGDQRTDVTVWSDCIDAADAGPEAAAWFSQFIGFSCRLMYMDEAANRPVAPEYASEGDIVSFADAMPLLLTTEASLADLNRRLPSPVPMSRFRPNVVVDGSAPWEEDTWKRVRIGDVEFEITHPCARCVVTTVDQQSGEKSRDGEPLKTLSTFRQNQTGVCFGMNLIPRGKGTIRVNDAVSVVS